MTYTVRLLKMPAGVIRGEATFESLDEALKEADFAVIGGGAFLVSVTDKETGQVIQEREIASHVSPSLEDETCKELTFNGPGGSATLTVDARSNVRRMGPDRYLVAEPGEKPRIYYLGSSTVLSREPLPSETFDFLPDLDAPKGTQRNP